MLLSHHPVRVGLSGVDLDGALHLPQDPTSVVVLLTAGVFGHTDLERTVTQQLNNAGVGTLILGLLTPEEADIDWLVLQLRFDIQLLARRVQAAMSWVLSQLPENASLGLFGTDTAGAAALVAAAKQPELVDAVVLMRGRADLAVPAIARLMAPTLLIVGGEDEPGIHSNEIGASHLVSPHELHIVPGAGQFFEETGVLEACAERTRNWFCHHFATDSLSLVG